MATGMVMTETTMNMILQAGREPLPDSDRSKPAWIQPPDMLPRLPNPQKTAALVPSSDCVYHDP